MFFFFFMSINCFLKLISKCYCYIIERLKVFERMYLCKCKSAVQYPKGLIKNSYIFRNEGSLLRFTVNL